MLCYVMLCYAMLCYVAQVEDLQGAQATRGGHGGERERAAVRDVVADEAQLLQTLAHGQVGAERLALLIAPAKAAVPVQSDGQIRWANQMGKSEPDAIKGVSEAII